MEVTEQPRSSCWLSSGVVVGRSAIEGTGLMARRLLAAGEPVARLGGRLVSDERLRELFEAASTTGSYVDTVSIDDGIDLVLPDGDPLHAGNHSCDPTMWWVDPYLLVARRDVPAGEELTLDYATVTDDPAYVLECRCGAAGCRGRVTGGDWRLEALRRAYGTHWVPGLRRRVERAVGG